MYGNNFYNPTRFQPGMANPVQPMPNNTYISPVQNQPMQNSGLQGKIVESIDVVKATDIPLDGSTSYFPLTDNSAIVTKKLKSDGTSEIIVYKPAEEKETQKFATMEDLDNKMKEIDLSELDDLKDDLREVKKQIKDLKKEMK